MINLISQGSGGGALLILLAIAYLSFGWIIKSFFRTVRRDATRQNANARSAEFTFPERLEYLRATSANRAVPVAAETPNIRWHA